MRDAFDVCSGKEDEKIRGKYIKKYGGNIYLKIRGKYMEKYGEKYKNTRKIYEKNTGKNI